MITWHTANLDMHKKVFIKVPCSAGKTKIFAAVGTLQDPNFMLPFTGKAFPVEQSPALSRYVFMRGNTKEMVLAPLQGATKPLQNMCVAAWMVLGMNE